MRDPYQILGVPRDADGTAIKRAYRRLARELHPDHRGGAADAEDEFKDLGRAYDLLSDPEKRAAYDRGEIDAGGMRTWRTRTGADRRRGGNPFEYFFHRRTAREDAAIRVAGVNVNYTLDVDLLDVARGTTRRIRMADGRSLDVAIPAGTADGQILRLRAQGMPGIGGGAPGDAHVEVRVAPHPLFRRDGDDIQIELSVTLPEAVAGGKIDAPTLDGPVSVTVPEGSNTGTVLRLKGRGLVRPGGGRGDEYITLKVVLPDKPDHELAAFVKTWGAKNPYEVRPKNVDVD